MQFKIINISPKSSTKFPRRPPKQGVIMCCIKVKKSFIDRERLGINRLEEESVPAIECLALSGSEAAAAAAGRRSDTME